MRNPNANRPSRRGFLRGVGIVAALPFLESLAPTVVRAGLKVPAQPPLRFGVYTVTGGTVEESWVPEEVGTLGKLPSILRPLESHKSELLVLSNLSQSGKSDGKVNAHEHCAYLHLTGVDKVGKVDGKPFAGQSVDQRAAELVGAQSLMPSLQLGYAGGETAFFFDGQGRSLPVERDPRLAFERMFAGRRLVAPNWPRRLETARQSQQTGQTQPIPSGAGSYQKRVVDLLLEDAKSLQRRLGRADQGKLSEYLESIHSIERRVQRVEQRIAIEAMDLRDPGPSSPHAPSGLPVDRSAAQKFVQAVGRDPAVHAEYLRVMTDLMVLAFQTDTTRVCSLGLGSDEALFPGVVTVGYEHHAHTLEHHGNAARVEDADPVAREGCRQIHAWYTQYFAEAIAKMRAIDEGGSSLLDNTVLLYTSYMADGGHGRRNYPVLLAGRGGGTLKTGRHIAYQKDTPMANLYVEPIAGPVFAATGENGMRVFSPDGKTLTQLQTDREGVLLKYVAFYHGRCFTAGRFGGDWLVFWSADAMGWESTKLPMQPYAERLELLFVVDDRVCGIISTDGQPPQATFTTDGHRWTPRKPLVDDWKVMVRDAHLRRVAQGHDRIVFTGDYGARLSANTIDDKFQALPQASAKDTLIDIAFGNGVFVGGGLHGLRMRSVDGLQWTDRVVGEEGEHINSLLFDGQQFVGIGQGATYFSTDGKTWERIENQNAPTVATFGSGVYVGALWPGKIMRSTDGIHWQQTHPLPHHVLALTYGKLGEA